MGISTGEGNVIDDDEVARAWHEPQQMQGVATIDAMKDDDDVGAAGDEGWLQAAFTSRRELLLLVDATGFVEATAELDGVVELGDEVRGMLGPWARDSTGAGVEQQERLTIEGFAEQAPGDVVTDPAGAETLPWAIIELQAFVGGDLDHREARETRVTHQQAIAPDGLCNSDCSGRSGCGGRANHRE